jgi:hypothetical protein
MPGFSVDTHDDLNRPRGLRAVRVLPVERDLDENVSRFRALLGLGEGRRGGLREEECEEEQGEEDENEPSYGGSSCAFGALMIPMLPAASTNGLRLLQLEQLQVAHLRNALEVVVRTEQAAVVPHGGCRNLAIDG